MGNPEREDCTAPIDRRSTVAGGCGQAEAPEEHRGKLFVLEAGECARADELEELGEVLP